MPFDIKRGAYEGPYCENTIALYRLLSDVGLAVARLGEFYPFSAEWKEIPGWGGHGLKTVVWDEHMTDISSLLQMKPPRTTRSRWKETLYIGARLNAKG